MARPAWLICGTVPDATFGLHEGVWQARLTEDPAAPVELFGEGLPSLPVQRGTGCLMACAALAAGALGLAAPRTLLAGDTGTGEGSKALYSRLAAELPGRDGALDGITFHYLYPDVDGHNRVLMALDSLRARPLLVADAGFMYVAKMSGYAAAYDVFTPDAGEMAFLADEMAPHPFYTRGFLLAGDDDVPDLVRRAASHDNAAKVMLVKGRTDCVTRGGEVLARVSAPMVPHMEPIGGTGDMVTALVTALLMAGLEPTRACVLAARANRLTGARANPTPATQVAQLLPFVPEVLREVI